MPIPKILFQTWKSKTVVPENFAYWAATFRTENPTYDYRLWDDNDNRAFIAEHYPWFLGTYNAYPAEIYRADAVRYFFLYHHGGIYADMDTECLRPLDSVLNAADVVLGRMGTNALFEHSLPNAVMLSAPRQEFWLLAMSLLLEPVPAKEQRPDFITGPVLLKRAHDLYIRREVDADVARRMADIRGRLPRALAPVPRPTRVAAVPGHVFFPLNWDDQIHNRFFRKPMLRGGQWPERASVLSLFPNSLTVSYWSHSWEPPQDRRTASR